ncbi:MAG: CvpA family protein [Flavobacteriales bacterium]|jgi:membrane protein required for colicin V production|nr:CvpA family protein [Flavobacteriales bacterium]
MTDLLNSFTWLDYAIAIPIIIAIAKGFWRGLILEAASFFGLILGFIGGIIFLSQVKDFLQNYIQLGNTALTVVAFITILLAIMLAISLIAKLVDYLFEIANLSFVNRLGGAAFGFISSFIIIGLLLLVLNSFMPNLMTDSLKAQSYLYDPMTIMIPQILDILGLEEIEELLSPQTLSNINI